MRKDSTVDLVVYSLLVSRGTVTGLWECGLKVFFMLVIDDFVIHSWSNGPCCTSLSCLLGTTVKIDDTPIFIIGVLSFRQYGQLLAGLPSDQPPS